MIDLPQRSPPPLSLRTKFSCVLLVTGRISSFILVYTNQIKKVMLETRRYIRGARRVSVYYNPALMSS